MFDYPITFDLFTIFIALGVGYCLGSIPSGLLLAKYFENIDLRHIGSGNIGATNALRTGNKKIAIYTLLCDIFKGVLPCLFFFNPVHLAVIAAGGAVLGHIFPIWLQFKGGKGVATFLGTVFVLSPLCALFAIAVWIVMAILFRYSSLAALVAILCSIITTAIFYNWAIFGYVSIFGTLIISMHHENIIRLINRTEPKIGQKTDDTPSPDA